MIACIGNEVRGKIINYVKLAEFFSVCLDTTPDSSKQAQLTVILRFVDKKAVKILECLIDLVHVKDTTGAGLVKKLMETIWP